MIVPIIANTPITFDLSKPVSRNIVSVFVTITMETQ